MPLSVGHVLNNRYRIVNLLGQGGFGAVYKAWDLNLERPCAVKENLDTTDEARSQFRREARMLADLDHHNLPNVIDHFYLTGQGQYLVMDYVEGEDLQSKLDKQSGKPLPEDDVLGWIDQVCDALIYLHEQNPPVIHRDIKPANIRITPDGKAILVDFGIAKLFTPGSMTLTGARAYTPGFASPEQQGCKGTDVLSDVYSLGATTYSLLTTVVPPSATDIISGMEPPPTPVEQINPNVSPRVGQTVLDALQLNRDQRTASVLEFKIALNTAARIPTRPAWLPWVGGIMAVLLLVIGSYVIFSLINSGGGDGDAAGTTLARSGTQTFQAQAVLLTGTPQSPTATPEPETETPTPEATETQEITVTATPDLEATAEAEAVGGEEAVETITRGAILDRVKERGKLVCGGRTNLIGFGYMDEAGNKIGFDIDLCRAVAAAVLGDPEAVEIVPLTAADRGPALQTAEVDMLSRNVTWTSSRDAQWGNFTTITFYDGQSFMVPVDSGIKTIEDMDGASVCVTSGTTTEKNLADVFRQRGLDYEAVIFEETASVYGAYEEGRCDVITSDRSQLAAVREGFANPEDHEVLDITISKEPLTAAVPHGDDQWFDIVKIVIFALINAEELGVTQMNVETMKNSEFIYVRRLLGQEYDWGYSDLGLDQEALANAIMAVGNYGEIYDRYMGPNGIAFTLPRGPNELYSNGGLIYAPPIK